MRFGSCRRMLFCTGKVRLTKDLYPSGTAFRIISYPLVLTRAVPIWVPNEGRLIDNFTLSGEPLRQPADFALRLETPAFHQNGVHILPWGRVRHDYVTKCGHKLPETG